MQTPAQRQASNQKYYLANRDKIYALNRATKRRNAAYVLAVKAQPCSDCGQIFHPAAMDFDHVHGQKVADIATLAAGGFSLKRIQAEIDKCELVCANCHRVRTWVRLEQVRNAPVSESAVDST